MVHALGRRHREVAPRALVKGAWAAKIRTGSLEGHVLADDTDNVRCLAYLLDGLVGNHDSSTTVTPAPPSFHAPSRKLKTRLSLLSISATRSRSAPVPFPWMNRSVLRSARTAESAACMPRSSISGARFPRKSI